MELTVDCDQLNEDVSGPSSLSSDQASLCVIPDPDDSSEEDDFIHLDKNCLPVNLISAENDRTAIVFHSVEEEYQVEDDILCQYIRPNGWCETPKDCVGLFKVGWVTVGECVAMVSVSETACHNNSVGCALFSAKLLPHDNLNFYQFCYLRESILLGASTPFQFKLNIDSLAPVGQGGNNENSAFLHAEEKLTEQLRSRDLDLTRLQEKFTMLACCKDEQDKVYFSTVEGLEKQLDFQSICIKKLVEEKAGLEIEKSTLSQEITELSALVEELKMKSFSKDNLGVSHLYEMRQNNKTLSGEISENFAACTSSVSPTPVGDFLNAEHQTSSDKQKEVNERNKLIESEYLLLKQRLNEVVEEKQFFQKQFGVASVALNKCTDELIARKKYITETQTIHRLVLEKLHNELKAANHKLQEHKEFADKCERDKASQSTLKNQLHVVIAENVYLKEELDYLRNLNKRLEERSLQTCSKCEDSKKELEEMAIHLSASDLIKATLQVELDEEIKLGEDRDRRLAQLEQAMLSNLRLSSEQAVSAVGGSSATSLFEMEQNIHSTLEALECALKEIETLRSRKAALSRANRTLRDGIAREKSEWEEKTKIEREEYANQLLVLTKQLESESSDKLDLQKKIQEQERQCNEHISGLEHTDFNDKNTEMEANTRSVLEALEAAQKEIDSLRIQRTSLFEQCSLLRHQLDGRTDACIQSDIAQDHKCDLAGKLQEACDEYHKLYIEKKHIQEKLDRLQQKIKTKVNARSHQSTLSSNPQCSSMLSSLSSSTIPDDSEQATCRSAAWRAMVEELM